MKIKSQRDFVRTALKQGKKLTPLTALKDCGTMRLGAIIHELRSKEKYVIFTDLITFKTRHGFKGQYASYRMNPKATEKLRKIHGLKPYAP